MKATYSEAFIEQALVKVYARGNLTGDLGIGNRHFPGNQNRFPYLAPCGKLVVASNLKLKYRGRHESDVF
jgi:hypothetical protein